MTDQVDLDSILAFAVQIALEAGEMIRVGQAKHFASEASIGDEKTGSVDLVTEVDKAVEAFLTGKIRNTYPDHEFIGEETYDGGLITEKPTWIVDPIDGTTNFIHGFPVVATSIGLAVDGVPVLGVIYNPFLDQLYSAAKGRGAYLNQKIRLPLTGKAKPLADLSHALIGMEYGSTTSARMSPALPSRTQSFQNLLGHPDLGGKMIHGLRDVGSAAMNICLVATGALDIHWEIGCWMWDVCAGICILTEAGGACFGGKNGPHTGEITGALLSGRKYLFIRSMAVPPNQGVLESQIRFAEEFYTMTDEIEP